MRAEMTRAALSARRAVYVFCTLCIARKDAELKFSQFARTAVDSTKHTEGRARGPRGRRGRASAQAAACTLPGPVARLGGAEDSTVLGSGRGCLDT